jgi:RNA-directed DNA polymerase
MEEVCERENLKGALKRVRANRGGPGADGMTVEELPGYLKEHCPVIREQLPQATYQPQPVKRVETLKGGGRVRQLRVPTVLDRLIHQGVLQVLQ